MSNNNQDSNTQAPKQVTIGASTQIIFTVKSFIATILTILGLFIGFYRLVVVPTLNKSEEHQKDLYEEQKSYISGEFTEVKASIENNTKAINLNTEAINSTNDRFKDLNNAVNNINTSGSLGETALFNSYVNDTANYFDLNDSTYYAIND